MKLLIVDPNLSRTSPSMKGIVAALPALKAQGWEIEVWCWHADEEVKVDRIEKLPQVGKVHTLDSYAFSFWVRLRAWWKFRVQRHARPDVVYSVAWYLPSCEVCHVHFSPFDWERRQRTLGMRSMRDVFERVTNLGSLWLAKRFLHSTTAKRVLCVSEAVAGDVRKVNPKLNVQVLPNSYDAKRFHPALRGLHREALRNQLGISTQDHVFVFVSAGHYRRKGFFLAVDAVAKLRERGGQGASARLLVLGGSAQRLQALKQQLQSRHPDWDAFVTFTGMVPDVEKYLSSADGFLFPSYSEAFALVEVEAAACGLPLFLTPHHGSEMILEDGVNGRRVEFDAVRIADVLEEYVTGAWQPERGVHLKHALDGAAYAERFAAELALALPDGSRARLSSPNLRGALHAGSKEETASPHL
ncbi:glycosyltransferase involved in cell wall biosynthesis [Roseimicrobium gellanilyticum]|uniref:Glycosyltransferase involved in cell wall biosynthesis n=1 Tax=Roseimicrobium gellanilyticum TaxID=748857 RepID=A0A366H3E8_9BACT|nr:glycosyltransferase [Roseimicrobium gellanilyticum]RBP36363.1 glycosyltransferase involved in cell wall biosynthesis [Roseimicrobium gellanilyticum]